MKPWEYPLPPILYKYFPPERIHVLKDRRVRFSQRTVFDDDHELQPDFALFGTINEIWRFTLASLDLRLDNRIPPDILIQLIAESPKYQARALQVAQAHMKSPDAFGVFCLTESPDCERMWTEYADNGKGFVIAFDTAQADFEQLRTPGKLGKVEYSDEPLGSFLGMMENQAAGIFFRKRMKYAFEAEWRSIRALTKLEEHPGDVYLAPFSPASVREVIIRPGCSLEANLGQLIGSGEYGHANITVQDA